MDGKQTSKGEVDRESGVFVVGIVGLEGAVA
jgi:hypothetical protein